MEDRDQEERFGRMGQLVDEAETAIRSLQGITDDALQSVDHDSSAQAEQLQLIQQQAGCLVQAATEVAEVARRARSHQAQAHHES